MSKTKIKTKLTIKPYQRVIAVGKDDVSSFRTDAGNKDKPKVFVIEYVDLSRSMFRLFQVGSYSTPLWFDFSGYPCLSTHSRSSMLHKNWNGWRLVDLPKR
jgi:hypothetical protein